MWAPFMIAAATVAAVPQYVALPDCLQVMARMNDLRDVPTSNGYLSLLKRLRLFKTINWLIGALAETDSGIDHDRAG